MHILLTGAIQVGKTSIIRRLLSRTCLSADGFLTYWEPNVGGGRSLLISPYNPDLKTADRRVLARDSGNRFDRAEDMDDIFNVYGVELINESGKRDIVVMDELGIFESGAAVFQNAVLRRLDLSVPVLGVIKPARTEFLDAVRAHPDVRVYEVTPESRNDVLAKLLSEFQHIKEI